MKALGRNPVLDKHGVEIRRGDFVRVLKGTVIQTTSSRERAKIAGRSYKIRVRSISEAYEYHGDRSELIRVAARVVWAGEGSYWHECDAIDVERVEVA